MRRTLVISLSVIAVGVLTQAARAQPVPTSVEQPPSFKYVDINEDGYIERDEARHARVLYGNAFIKADTNKDGKLTKAEYDRAMQRQRQQAMNQHRGG